MYFIKSQKVKISLISNLNFQRVLDPIPKLFKVMSMQDIIRVHVRPTDKDLKANGAVLCMHFTDADKAVAVAGSKEVAEPGIDLLEGKEAGVLGLGLSPDDGIGGLVEEDLMAPVRMVDMVETPLVGKEFIVVVNESLHFD